MYPWLSKKYLHTLKYKQRYPGNATVAKHSLPDTPKKKKKKKKKKGDDDETMTKQRIHMKPLTQKLGRAATEELPWNGQ